MVEKDLPGSDIYDWKAVETHYRVHRAIGLTGLRELFPDGKADEMNFVFFSTSGVHGSYTTIEEIESEPTWEDDDTGELIEKKLTFLVVQPRRVSIFYGNCIPKSAEDFDFLKTLRATSLAAIKEIGWP